MFESLKKLSNRRNKTVSEKTTKLIEIPHIKVEILFKKVIFNICNV